MSNNPPLPDWDAVDRYVRERLVIRKDVYGWARSAEGNQPVALILASISSGPESFPELIGNVTVRVKHVGEPEKYS
jgi:hypothetical protein